MRLFGNRSTSICYFTTFVYGVALSLVLFFLLLYSEDVRAYNPIVARAAALPQTCTIVLCAVAFGFIAAKTGRYRWALWAGWVLTTFGCGMLYLLDVVSTITQCIFFSSNQASVPNSQSDWLNLGGLIVTAPNRHHRGHRRDTDS
jgi:Na+/melibiose symporter-like transporter